MRIENANNKKVLAVHRDPRPDRPRGWRGPGKVRRPPSCRTMAGRWAARRKQTSPVAHERRGAGGCALARAGGTGSGTARPSSALQGIRPRTTSPPSDRTLCSTKQVALQEVGEDVLGDLRGEAVPGKVVVVVGERELRELVGHTRLVQLPVQLSRLRRQNELVAAAGHQEGRRESAAYLPDRRCRGVPVRMGRGRPAGVLLRVAATTVEHQIALPPCDEVHRWEERENRPDRYGCSAAGRRADRRRQRVRHAERQVAAGRPATERHPVRVDPVPGGVRLEPCQRARDVRGGLVPPGGGASR